MGCYKPLIFGDLVAKEKPLLQTENGNPGDPLTTDPPQEPQGLNSVFSSDKSTLDIVKKYNLELKK